MVISSAFTFLESSGWRDYELLDSGGGLKLERFGAYTFVRPEVQAMWRPALSEQEWAAAHAVFRPSGEEGGGHWIFKKKVPERWELAYGALRFWAMTTPGRHLGVFPEAASHWDFIADTVQKANLHPAVSHDLLSKSRAAAARGMPVPATQAVSPSQIPEAKRRGRRAPGPNGVQANGEGSVAPSPAEGRWDSVKVLNLFGYTGLATLAAAAAGAQVTHVDASKKSVAWARENQALSKLGDKPIRWIVDDALKFVEREGRRGAHYDGILLEPPKFGRGPKGEVWEVYKSLPHLLEACQTVLSDRPLFVIITAYAVKASAIHLGQALQEMMSGHRGRLDHGELVTREKSAGRLISQAVYARWQAE